MYKDSLKVSDRWHIIKAETRAYDLSGQEHRQENEDSLFVIGQPELEIVLKKLSKRTSYKMKGSVI